jgi:tetratricopeptide (TPR) repeat protein
LRSPGDIETQKREAIRLKEERRYEAALAAFESLVTVAPRDPDVRYHLATLIALMTQRHEDAVGHLRAALAERPDDIPALECLTDLYSLQEKYDAALQTVDRLISLRPYQLAYLCQAAEVCMRMNDRGRSLEYLNRATLLQPQDAETLGRIGSLLYHWAETARAEEYLIKAVKKDPNDSRANFELARMAFRQRNLKRAEHLATRSIFFNPFVQETHNLLAQIYASMKRETEAKREVRIGEYLNHMSEIKLGFFKHLLQVGAASAEEHFALGEELARVGQPVWAIRELGAGLVLEPTAQAPLIPLALAYLDTKEPEKAYTIIDRLSDPGLRRTEGALSALGWSAYQTHRLSVARNVIAAASALHATSENLRALAAALQSVPPERGGLMRWLAAIATIVLGAALLLTVRKHRRT